MRKILVFKHVAQENLGSIRPVLAEQGFRIRYVNFQREPDAAPSLEKYKGLVVLGGWMGVYEADRYPHLHVECKLIEEALKKEIPVLGICLGSQILAHVLGAHVRKHTEEEAGWKEVELTDEGRIDVLLKHFRTKERVFQMHGDTFDIPESAIHLAKSEVCPGQAFRYGSNAYGLQFHLEADQDMIRRFLSDPKNRQELERFGGTAESLEKDTEIYLARSLELGRKTFSEFLRLFGFGERWQARLGHGKPQA